MSLPSTHNTATSKQFGFTLIELLVSMMIFSLMSVMAYSGLINIFKSNDSLISQEARLKTLKRSMMFIERDMRQLVLRNRSAGFEEAEGAFVYGLDSEGLLEFTRAGNSNPLDLNRSTLQRVRYDLEENKIMRSSWNLVDHLDAEPVTMTLIDDVEELTLRILSKEGEWQDTWGIENTSLPKAVELNLEHKYWGKIRRIIPVE